MPRPKEFDQELALDKAMEVFWQKGFERTSIQDLVEQTGVHRGSLYDTFGDKNQFFLTCLDRFRQVSSNRLFSILDEPGSPKEVLSRFFEKVIDNALGDGTGRRGCFLANTAMELAAIDPGIASRVEAYNIDMESRFYHFLLKAQKHGEKKFHHTLRELSRFLVNTRNGLYVLGKTASDRQSLQDVVKVALSFL
ncbi:TetR/AcrR family transcriptional regulator [Paenibacillus alginolyticus]|uniref:TetR/AcrR family transcriptional regulator n=1 Tax=Paenibacillus alginolyticus TaxID=59839 RepID=A0ABT4G919_9BACL|nr:TetR/AcrR family transcriptional regulator [Paenibacillus alginolyticus]MCY9692686.1 TetR/AcrR family transcriptional regulator [Paenibacillus alginolyticus]MEC0144387.1 TetR family transcriptional regulator [Paenibacillus alginolyticus]